MYSSSWIFGPPREILTRESLSRFPRGTALGTLASALLSYATAETYMEISNAPAGQGVPWAHVVSVKFSLALIAFALFLGVVYQGLKFFTESSLRFELWFKAGVIAMMPIHLALPLA